MPSRVPLRGSAFLDAASRATLIPKLFPGHVLGDATFRLTSFVSQSPGTIADQWECKDLDRTTTTSEIGRKEF